MSMGGCFFESSWQRDRQLSPKSRIAAQSAVYPLRPLASATLTHDWQNSIR